MVRHYDLAEDPDFWDALDELEGDPAIIGELVGTLAQRAVDDPYRTKELEAHVRVLRSLPVMRGGVVYAFRLAYLVIEHETPVNGKDGVVLLLHVAACDAEEMLGTARDTTPDRNH